MLQVDLDGIFLTLQTSGVTINIVTLRDIEADLSITGT